MTMTIDGIQEEGGQKEAEEAYARTRLLSLWGRVQRDA